MEAALTTRQYEEQRAAVHAHLRRSFGRLFDEGDRDDLLHDAWTAVVVKHEAGEKIENETALLKTIAYRRGRDRLRGRHSDPCDPLEGALTLLPDSRPGAGEQVEMQLEADLCREVIAALKERQQKLLKLRLEWGLPAAEVQLLLGMTQRTYERQMTKALKRVAQIVSEIEDGTWSQKQLDLLIAVEAGTATAAQRADAQRLVERDPHCRALLGRLRGAAAAMPLPFVVPDAGGVLGGILATFKQHISAVAVRVQGASDSVASVASGGGAKGTGGLSGVATAKVASLLIAGTAAIGGGTAVGTGTVDMPGQGRSEVRAKAPVTRPAPRVQVAGVTASSASTAPAERRALRAAKRRAARRRAKQQQATARHESQPAAQQQQQQQQSQPSPSATKGELASGGDEPPSRPAASTAQPGPTVPSTAAPAAPADAGGEFGP